MSKSDTTRKKSRNDPPRDGRKRKRGVSPKAAARELLRRERKRGPLPPVIKVKIGQTWDPKLGRMRPQTKAERAAFEPALARSMRRPD